MKLDKFTIPLYEYNVIFIQVDSPSDAPEVEKILKTISTNVIENEIKNNVDRIKNNVRNDGRFYYNHDVVTSVIIISQCTSKREKCRIIAHEKRHLEDKVLEWAHVNDNESAALLAGYLQNKLF